MSKDLQTLNGQNKLALWAGRISVPKQRHGCKDLIYGECSLQTDLLQMGAVI